MLSLLKILDDGFPRYSSYDNNCVCVVVVVVVVVVPFVIVTVVVAFCALCTIRVFYINIR